jgi:hypothetical protein
MKIIKYRFLSAEVNHGTEDAPEIKQIFIDKSMGWSEANEEIAKQEAYNGEYTIEDDGQPEVQTPEQRIAELEQALEMLLSGVTE